MGKGLNVFEIMKIAKEVQPIAEAGLSALQEFKNLDENENGIPDGIELLQELKELPELMVMERSKDLKVADEARRQVAEKMKKIMTLVGEDAQAIVEKTKDEVAIIEKHVANLQK